MTSTELVPQSIYPSNGLESVAREEEVTAQWWALRVLMGEIYPGNQARAIQAMHRALHFAGVWRSLNGKGDEAIEG